MDFPLNLGGALFGDRTASSADAIAERRCSVSEAALFAYRFLFRRFWALLGLIWFPFFLAGFLLYSCFSGYLSHLLLYVSVPNPHTASLALGMLAAGVFLSLFCYTVAVAAITRLTLEGTDERALFYFKAQRREWRLYAAYLRFLLLVTIAIGLLAFSSMYLSSLLNVPRDFAVWAATGVGFIVVYWLVARVAFLIPPLAAEKEGPILRSAWKSSGRDIMRICGLIFVLLIPGLLVQALGEYALRAWTSTPTIVGDVAVADYARFMEQALVGFLVVVGLSSFITIVLLTAGAIAFHQKRDTREAALRAI